MLFLFHTLPFTAAVLYSAWHATILQYQLWHTDYWHTFVFYGYCGSLYLVQNCNPHPKLRNGYFHIPNYTMLKYGSWRFFGFIVGCNRTLPLFHCIYEHTVVLKNFCLWTKPVRTALTFPSGSSTNPSISVAVIFPKCPIWPFSLRPVNVSAIFQNLAKKIFKRYVKHSITSSYST